MCSCDNYWGRARRRLAAVRIARSRRASTSDDNRPITNQLAIADELTAETERLGLYDDYDKFFPNYSDHDIRATERFLPFEGYHRDQSDDKGKHDYRDYTLHRLGYDWLDSTNYTDDEYDYSPDDTDNGTVDY